jgi:ABC-type multidrug transport system ATPase subunit
MVKADALLTPIVAYSLACLGHPYDKKKLKQVSGYVLQDDLLLPYLTVRYGLLTESCLNVFRECILFSARLRLPATMSLQEKKQRVRGILTFPRPQPFEATKQGILVLTFSYLG